LTLRIDRYSNYLDEQSYEKAKKIAIDRKLIRRELNLIKLADFLQNALKAFFINDSGGQNFSN